MNYIKRIGIDAYMILLLATVIAGIVLPATGVAAEGLRGVTFWAVSLLFFLYGAKLDPSAVKAGITNWRLQGMTFGATYVLFPLIGLLLATLCSPILGATVTMGLLFLSVLPSTVQSSIAFTSIAGGNVPAALTARFAIRSGDIRATAASVWMPSAKSACRSCFPSSSGR